MVETERFHRSGRSRTSDFFLCFSFRSSSSSSMKISSKSALSPGRSREPSLSLSSSLSRRLRSNGSMKGGQASPMFPTGSKKKGGSFDPAEPSSPKVTCIGQVRVKSKKKHGRKLRTRSGRRGEVSFRKTEQPQDGIHHQQQAPQECLPHRNQRWVHLPLSICETLRGFGNDFNCFVPCGGRSSSSCSWSSDREKGGKRRGRGSSSCGGVFARWLFAIHESDEKGSEVGDVRRVEEKKDNRGERESRENREVVTEMKVEILEEKMEMKVEEIEEDEEEMEEGRESICVPPKNALLLMRSRSAPFRMSSLANRFWESPTPNDNVGTEVEDAEELELEIHNVISEKTEVQKEALEDEKDIELVENKEVEMLEMLVSSEMLEEDKTSLKEEEEISKAQSRKEEEKQNVKAMVDNGFSMESIEEEKTKFEVVDEQVKEVVERKDERRVSFSSSTMYLEPEEESEDEEEEEEEGVEKLTDEEASVSVSASEEEKEILPRSTTEEQQVQGQEDEESQEESKEREESLLPECLLLMMCEPKLSMEVSKETWVCSTDFVRYRHSEKKVVQKNGQEEPIKKKRLSTDSNPGQPTKHPLPPKHKQDKKEKEFQVQPPRSSCSKVEPLVATTIEQKLTKAGGYEPFVLKRCKSEPMRNSAKLAPEACFWNKNKLETTHRPPSLGVGATS